MILIYGMRPYGAVSTPAGEVATQFFHLFYVPLFPVAGLRMKGEHAFPAPLHAKSVVLAYARVFGLLASVGLLVHTYFEVERSLATGALWLLATLGLALANAAAWFVIGARTLDPRQRALAFGLPALAVLLALTPAFRENRHRQQWDTSAAVDAQLAGLPTELAEQVRSLGPADQKKALALLTKTKVDTQRWEPDWSRCQLRRDGATCMKVAKAASLAGDDVYARSGAQLACHGSEAEGCLLYGRLTSSEQEADWAFSQACKLGSGVGCAEYATRVKTPADATKLYEKACSLDSATGCRSLGEALRSGTGVKKNVARAKTALKKACTLGGQAACSG